MAFERLYLQKTGSTLEPHEERDKLNAYLDKDRLVFEAPDFIQDVARAAAQRMLMSCIAAVKVARPQVLPYYWGLYLGSDELNDPDRPNPEPNLIVVTNNNVSSGPSDIVNEASKSIASVSSSITTPHRTPKLLAEQGFKRWELIIFGTGNKDKVLAIDYFEPPHQRTIPVPETFAEVQPVLQRAYPHIKPALLMGVTASDLRAELAQIARQELDTNGGELT